jgi:integrase
MPGTASRGSAYMTCATRGPRQLQAGVDIKVVSERLGHSTPSFTRDIYQHVTPVMQTAAAEKVSGLLDF